MSESEMTARDTRMLERALKQKWNIPAEAFDDAPKALHGIVKAEAGVSKRNKIAAARALVLMHGQNVGIDAPSPTEGQLPVPTPRDRDAMVDALLDRIHGRMNRVVNEETT